MGNEQALVFGGGGASGAYLVGAAKALLSGASPGTGFTALDPAIVTGTSIGAMNASFLVSHWQRLGPQDAVAQLEKLWLERLASWGCSGAFRPRFNPWDWLSPRGYRRHGLRPLAWLLSDLAAMGRLAAHRVGRVVRSRQAATERLMELIDGHHFYALDAWDELLQEAIDYPAILSSKQTLRIAATRWQEGTVRVFTNPEMTPERGPTAVKASCSVQVFFPPTAVDGLHYIDGSVGMYAPVSPAVQAGGREIHLITMNVDVDSVPADGHENTFQALFRALIMYWAADVERELERARAYNTALARLTSPAPSADGENQDFFAAVAALGDAYRPEPPYRPLTVHRYSPRGRPFEGILSIADFHIDRVRELIELGFAETAAHDCRLCGCVLPEETVP